MKLNKFCIPLVLLAFMLASCHDSSPVQKNSATDPLPSWHEGLHKQKVLEFIDRTTSPGHHDFIPEEDRIACFDNDGTLWSEQPYYFQLAFAIDRIKELSIQHPEWRKKQPFKAVLENNINAAMAEGEHAILEMVMMTHAGITVEEFDSVVRAWIDTARHPSTGLRYVDMIYQPILELLQHLRSKGYKTYIVSGGGADFLRVWTSEVYGIPAEQVIGSTLKLKYEEVNGKPNIYKLPVLDFINDKAGKPIGIQGSIGKRPVIAVGNSDGDYEMLHWTTTGSGYERLGIMIHHTDSAREWAYDRNSSVGRLARGLDDARKNGWLVISMKNDWKKIRN